MRNFSKILIQTTLTALLTCVIFSGCSFLDRNSSVTASVSFSLNTARAAGAEDGNTFVDVELTGDYKDSQTAALTGNKVTVTFDKVPVGKSVSVSAKIYTLYDDAKAVLYAGESEKKVITEGENPFTVPLQTAYNSIAKGTSSCLILKPLFTSEATNETLKSNKLDFTSESETFAFKVNTVIDDEPIVLDEYQKAIITIKGAAEGEHAIRTKFVKSPTAAMYYQDPVIISTETKPYELIIPQGIKLDSIGFENSWNNDDDDWASDYSIIIEKIELFKDSSLVDPDFNVVTKTASTYTVKNPALQIIANTSIDNNKISFNPTGPETYCAAYWEFDNLSDYDKVTITYRTGSEHIGKSFFVNGFLPTDYILGRDQKHSADVDDVDDPNNYLNQIKILEITIPREIYINPILTTPKDDENFSLSDLKAIEFKSGVTTDWDLEIKEIKLEKVGTANFSFNTPSAEGDITVTVKVGSTTISPGELIEVSGNQTVKFTAPNTYTSYVWKVNGEVQSETSNVFSLSTESLSNQIYNITLFADTDTVHHSWQTEISKS